MRMPHCSRIKPYSETDSPAERMKVIPNDIFFAEVERIIAEGNSVIVPVRGNSMRPFIRDGRTSVRMSPCDPQSLENGDIVLFKFRGQHVMHRIVKHNGDTLLLAGDGNYKKVERCSRGDVVAIVDAVIGRNGRTTLCDSRRWRLASRCWISLHPFVRRCILAFLWRIGIR